jgi:hypothetical protein
MVRASNPGFGFGEGSRKSFQAQAQRRGDLDGIYNTTVLSPGRLEMGAPDVPSDDNAHILPAPGRCDTFIISGFFTE